MTTSPLILLAAGGTGGHLFPAEALGVELLKRGLRVRLATDARALRYSGLFSRETIDVVPSETVRGRTPWSLARTGVMLADYDGWIPGQSALPGNFDLPKECVRQDSSDAAPAGIAPRSIANVSCSDCHTTPFSAQ